MQILSTLIAIFLFSAFATSYAWSDTSDEMGGNSLYFSEAPLGEAKLADYYSRAKRDIMQSDSEIQQFLEPFATIYNETRTLLRQLFNGRWNRGRVDGRLKTIESIKKKMQKDGTTLQDLNDIVGFRVTFPNVTLLRNVMPILEAAFPVFDTPKCYGVCSNRTFDLRPDDGYRRVHYSVTVSGKKIEIQLSTPFMTMFADWSHELLYKGPSDIKNDPQVNEYSLAIAHYLLYMDNLRGDSTASVLVTVGGQPECPQTLLNADARAIYKNNLGETEGDEMWVNMGSPSNGCFQWNDMKVNREDSAISAGFSKAFNGAMFVLCTFSILF